MIAKVRLLEVMWPCSCWHEMGDVGLPAKVAHVAPEFYDDLVSFDLPAVLTEFSAASAGGACVLWVVRSQDLGEIRMRSTTPADREDGA